MKHENLAVYLAQLHLSEGNLAEAYLMVADRHDRDGEVNENCRLFGEWTNQRVESLQPFLKEYGEDKSKNEQVQMLRGALFHGTRIGGMGLLADLQDLMVLTNRVIVYWTDVWQVGKALKDKNLENAADEACKSADRQLAWLRTQVKNISPQALTVPAEKHSELPASLPKKQTPTTQQDVVWSPTASGLLMLIVGGLALLAGILLGKGAGLAWLFPSLGPTAYLQAESPAHPSARFYNTVVGHAVGLAAGFVGVFVTFSYFDPVVLVSHELTWGRVLAAAIALALTVMVCLLLKASHPPAGATTLLVALGAFKIEDILTVAAGVLIIGAAGELFRRMRLGDLTLRPETREEHKPAPKPQG
jgi:HPP family